MLKLIDISPINISRKNGRLIYQMSVFSALKRFFHIIGLGSV